MRIDILYFHDCPHHRPTVDLVRCLLRELRLQAEVREIEVGSSPGEERLRFRGSPTVLVNGRDIEPGDSPGEGSMGCRLYGSTGVPPRELLEAALQGGAA